MSARWLLPILVLVMLAGPAQAATVFSKKQYILGDAGLVQRYPFAPDTYLGGASWSAAELDGRTHIRVDVREGPYIDQPYFTTRHVAAHVVAFGDTGNPLNQALASRAFCGSTDFTIPAETTSLAVFLASTQSMVENGCVSPGTAGWIYLSA